MYGIALLGGAVVLGCAWAAPLSADGRAAIALGGIALVTFATLQPRASTAFKVALLVAFVIGSGDTWIQRAAQPALAERPTARFAGTVEIGRAHV